MTMASLMLPSSELAASAKFAQNQILKSDALLLSFVANSVTMIIWLSVCCLHEDVTPLFI